MEEFKWPDGAQAAVSLSYDGGLPEQLHLAHPLLRILRLPATFYLSATFFLENSKAWSAVSALGYEIGNHSLFGVTGPRGELPNWTLEMVESDLHDTETLLRDYLPSSTDRSFAYPGDLPTCFEGSYQPAVESQFRFARTSFEGVNHPVFCNPQALLSVRCDGMSGAGMVEKAEEAAELGAWIIFAVEDIGSKRGSFGEVDHEILLRHLAGNPNRFFVGSVYEIGNHIVACRKDLLTS